MNACVFLGPTLALEDARQILDADYLSPVRQGDVYRAVRRYRPRVIGIVDGYFHQVPSVWHKEILWAMAEGVHVLGGSSMGALRAAELEHFGMRGVGKVFAAFRDNLLEDDDEVAVIHGPAETGYVAASEALVNIRETLAAATTDGVVGAPTRAALLEIAKSLYYPKRNYPELLDRGASAGLPGDELSALNTWLGQGRVDQKRADALALLEEMRDLLTDELPPCGVGFAFEHTTMWASATAAFDALDAAAGDEQIARDWLLDELRLEAGAYAELRHGALLRLLARREADREPLEVTEDELRRQAKDFRMARGLHFRKDLDRWLAERDLDRRDWERLMADEALVGKLTDSTRVELEHYIIDQLRTNDEYAGDYARLAVRARAKRERLASAGEGAESGGNDMNDLRALAWYFEQRLGTAMPEDLDACASRLGFASRDAFQRAVAREYQFQLAEDVPGGAGED